uniref:Pre-mRNA-splicing factor Syf1-like N-terminal HAT-repeats domain-containing protein n=1 Tax=Brassica oleracea TaxID=3712 RepID=A0A3P6FYJ1_BRAOL|nr:unnamed protein product [Brassica oleracea]
MKNKFVNSARHVWDRAVYLLPRVDLLWYKYSHMEEMLGNIAGARQIFERWMNWSPDQQGWLSFAKFELRYNETERARSIYERFFLCHPKASSFIRYAEFEVKCGEVSQKRGMSTNEPWRSLKEAMKKQRCSILPLLNSNKDAMSSNVLGLSTSSLLIISL